MKRYCLLLFLVFILAAPVCVARPKPARAKQRRIIRLHVVFMDIHTGAITSDAYISVIEGNSIHVSHGDEKIEITPKVVR